MFLKIVVSCQIDQLRSFRTGQASWGGFKNSIPSLPPYQQVPIGDRSQESLDKLQKVKFDPIQSRDQTPT
jgi:hypothetical protein